MESGPHCGLQSSYLSRYGDGRAIPTHASPGRVRDRYPASCLRTDGCWCVSIAHQICRILLTDRTMESGPHRGLPSSYLSRHGDGRAIPTHALPGRVRDRCSIIMFAYRGRIDSTSDMSHFADRQDGLCTMESGPHRGLPSSYLSRHGDGRAIPMI